MGGHVARMREKRNAYGIEQTGQIKGLQESRHHFMRQQIFMRLHHSNKQQTM
jgi:hypothetical protein